MKNSTVATPKSNILSNAIYLYSIGNRNSLTPEQSKGQHVEETNTAMAKHFKDQLFPKFIRKREGFPETFQKEELVFQDGQIQAIQWEFADNSTQTINL